MPRLLGALSVIIPGGGSYLLFTSSDAVQQWAAGGIVALAMLLLLRRVLRALRVSLLPDSFALESPAELLVAHDALGGDER